MTYVNYHGKFSASWSKFTNGEYSHFMLDFDNSLGKLPQIQNGIFMKSYKIILLAPVLILSACTTSRVLTVGPNDFMVTSSGAGFSTAGVRSRVFKAATEFCNKKDKIIFSNSFQATPGEAGVKPPQASLNFKCIDENDPLAKNINLAENGMSHEQTGNITPEQSKANLSDDLRDLKKMLDDGLITEQEHQKLKAKLLEKHY